MNASTLRVRRATIEDLDRLRPLWQTMRLPVADLEPRLTEFQIVENSDNQVMGGIGLQLGERQGWLHSEGYTDFAIADTARELLWNRIRTLASNHGILRLWTQEKTPFWTQTGFKPADAESLKKLPSAWKTENSSWLTLQLKDEAAIVSLEKELAMFMAAEKERSSRVFQQARALKIFATILAIIFAIFVLGAAIYILKRNPALLHPGR